MSRLNFLPLPCLIFLGILFPHENLKSNPKDPSWTNKNIKKALSPNNRLYRKFISGGKKKEDETNFTEAINLVS